MEYAPEYTLREKVTRVSVLACLGLLVIVSVKRWLEPVMNTFSERPHCYEFYGFNAAEHLWHIAFVGIPLSAWLLASLVMLPIGIRGLRDKQFPPKSMKVFKPTVICRGMVGKVKSTAFFIVPTLMLFISVWGYAQAEKLSPIDVSRLHEAISCDD
ncbi:hypothetical protein [Photobacterium satsumensis]|uniref:hypothetical protein n=1 Tax=Photobacterium satsumensis TaxID=2910239 RepID=UPI003D0F7D4D